MKQSQYEITYLIDPKLSEEARGALCASFDEQITTEEGNVTASAPVLRKTLAYPIEKQNAAFIRVMAIEVGPEKIDELRNFLKKMEGVMRLTILATPPRTRMSAGLIEKHGKKRGKTSHVRPEKQQKEKEVKPAKEVTMQDVEKGIEEALVEEVK